MTTGAPISPVAHANNVLLKIVGNTFGNFCEQAGTFPEEQRRFWRQRSTMDVMFVVRRLWELGRASNAPLSMCFIDLQRPTIL